MTTAKGAACTGKPATCRHGPATLLMCRFVPMNGGKGVGCSERAQICSELLRKEQHA